MPCIAWKTKLKHKGAYIMRNSIWFLLAAVFSLHGLAFAEDDSNASTAEIISQEEKQEQAPVSECR